MLLKGRARYLVGGVIRRDLDERCPAQLGGKARPQRDDFHRRPPFRVCSTFPPNRPAGNAVGGETPSGGHVGSWLHAWLHGYLRPLLAAALLGLLEPHVTAPR